jgi:predicted transport protein
MAATGWTPAGDDDPTVKKLTNYYLRNNDEEGDRQYKLVLRRHDQDVLRALLDGQPPPKDSGSRVVDAYEYFQERLDAGADPRVVYAGIGRLLVVDVTLDRAVDDPQLIFESLNSTGLDLSQADLIRNFILMRLTEPEQTRLYDLYWRKIDELFRGAGSTFDAFARDYLALKTKATQQAKSEQVYQEFRDFFRAREASLGLEESLKDILRFARYYAAFILAKDVPPKIAPVLDRVSRLAEVSAVLVMQLFDLHAQGGLPIDDFAEALELLESYVFRRSVCGLQTRGYWQVFAPMTHRLTATSPLETFKGVLARQRESYRYPKDGEFRDALRTRDIYGMKRTMHYLLTRLENFDTKEPTDTSSYTVEHVLPQNERLPPVWREMLGPDWQQIQQTWVNRLGNLTLTAYNSTYSDRPFDDKKTIKGGFNESAVRLNKTIRDAAKWTAAEIEARGDSLADRALKIWGPLVVSEATLKAVAQDDLRARAAKRSLEAVTMSAEAAALFALLRPRLLALDPGVIEVPEATSVAYHAADGDFFLEILPRTHRLVVLLNIERNECSHQDDDVIDTSDRSFFTNAVYMTPTAYKFRYPTQLEGLMKLARQAHDVAAQ